MDVKNRGFLRDFQEIPETVKRKFFSEDADAIPEIKRHLKPIHENVKKPGKFPKTKT